jgi:hypothetical protein
MAKVRAPLHSMDLRGRMADGFVFSDWKGIPWMRTFVMPSQPRTARREAMWATFPKVSREWAKLTDSDRARWDEFAVLIKPMNHTLGRKGNWSGFDAYVSMNTVLGDAGQPLVTQPPAIPLPNPPERFRLRNPSPGVVRIRWEPLPAGTLVDLWLNQTKASRKAYPSKFNHLTYADGTTGLHVLSGIPAGTRVAVKGRVVRPDGGKSYYAQAEIVV